MTDTSAQERHRAPTAAPRGELTVRTIAMPADTNANGDIFGGWVMAHMDQAGGIAGVERARGRVVTLVVERMTFIQPMRVGDVLEVYTEVESAGALTAARRPDAAPAWPARRWMTSRVKPGVIRARLA